MKVIYRRKRFWLSISIGILLLVYILHKADFAVLYSSIRHMNIWWIFVTFCCSAGSYICIAGILKTLLEATGNRVKTLDIFSIAFVSTVINYVVAFAGISGLALKIYLLAKKKIPPSQTLSVSIVHSFFTNTIGIVFIVVAFGFLYGRHYLEFGTMEIGVVLIFCAIILFLVFSAAFIVHGRFRKFSWELIQRCANPLARTSRVPRRLLEKINATFNHFDKSMCLMLENPQHILKAGLYALIDWSLMFCCLAASFLAVGYYVRIPLLIVGFCVGLFVSLISIIPGSVGIMESSMVSAFYLLGLDYDKSLLAIMLYRLVYYFGPTLVGIILFYRNLATFGEEAAIGKK
ncbi:MAG: flippase-like domain-containing protein [Deltaproteobacteria bacterium]|nr:flippase-like domain-containing protein [Deltaproteobacteria bacterium]MBW2068842.1 flippase-like domain-containing protein [Deltaproteobacteria bacterium]